MLCVHCGQREATEAVLYLRAEHEPAAGTPALPADLPLEFQEFRRMSVGPTVCAECLSAFAPAGVDLAQLESMAHAHIAAMPKRLWVYDRDELAPALRALVEEVLLASTAPTLELLRLRRALVSLLEFVTTPRGRSPSNLAFIERWVDTEEGWRAVNRNRARWQLLPAGFQEVLSELGAMTLVLAENELAEALGVTPAQLLAAARSIEVEPPA